jgi:hypothetical protein
VRCAGLGSKVWELALYLPSIMSVAALLPRTVDLLDQEEDPNFRLFSKESRALREVKRRWVKDVMLDDAQGRKARAAEWVSECTYSSYCSLEYRSPPDEHGGRRQLELNRLSQVGTARSDTPSSTG